MLGQPWASVANIWPISARIGPTRADARLRSNFWSDFWTHLGHFGARRDACGQRSGAQGKQLYGNCLATSALHTLTRNRPVSTARRATRQPGHRMRGEKDAPRRMCARQQGRTSSARQAPEFARPPPQGDNRSGQPAHGTHRSAGAIRAEDTMHASSTPGCQGLVPSLGGSRGQGESSPPRGSWPRKRRPLRLSGVRLAHPDRGHERDGAAQAKADVTTSIADGKRRGFPWRAQCYYACDQSSMSYLRSRRQPSRTPNRRTLERGPQACGCLVGQAQPGEAIKVVKGGFIKRNRCWHNLLDESARRRKYCADLWDLPPHTQPTRRESRPPNADGPHHSVRNAFTFVQFGAKSGVFVAMRHKQCPKRRQPQIAKT